MHMKQKHAFVRSQPCYCLGEVDALLREWAPLRLTASSWMKQRLLDVLIFFFSKSQPVKVDM